MNREAITHLTGRLMRIVCSYWVGVPLVTLLLCLASLLQYRQSRLADVPDIGDPFDVDAWGHIEFDPAANAATDYEAAARLYRGANKPPYSELDVVSERGWSEASSTVHRWLDDNRAALQAWHAGTEKDMQLRVQPGEMTFENFYCHDRELREILCLAWLEAERLESLGDSETAWRWHRASLRYCSHHGMNAHLIDRMWGATLRSGCVERIVSWARNAALTSHQLERSLADVRSAHELTSNPSVSIRVEYFILSDVLTRLEEHPEDYDGFATASSSPRNLHWADNLHLPPRWSLFVQNEPDLTRRLMRHQIANLLEFADEPLSRQPHELPEIDYFDVTDPTDAVLLSSSEFRTAIDKSFLARALLRTTVPRGICRERSRQGLLEMLLAAEWHRRETGEFPASIDELLTVPMLDEIPLDAFSRSGEALKYERDPDNPRRAKVWSVGKNGVDDGGSLEHVPSAGALDLGYWIVELESTPVE